MTEIKPEYPKGHRFIEMELVEMLAENRCWNDVEKIGYALLNVRKKAKSMKDEQKIQCNDSMAEHAKESPYPVVGGTNRWAEGNDDERYI